LYATSVLYATSAAARILIAPSLAGGISLHRAAQKNSNRQRFIAYHDENRFRLSPIGRENGTAPLPGAIGICRPQNFAPPAIGRLLSLAATFRVKVVCFGRNHGSCRPVAFIRADSA
jgi:hypothetical protein